MNREKKTHPLRNALLIMVVCIVIGCCLTWYMFNKEGNRSYASTSISFSFEGAAAGEAPNGYSFDVNDIAIEEVVSEALEASGMTDRYAVEDIQKNLSVHGVYPKDLISQMKKYASIADAASNQEVTVTNYHPSVFSIVLYKDFDPSLDGDQLTGLLENLVAAYKKRFSIVYAMGLRDEIDPESLTGYDYFQQLELVEGDLEQAKTYAEEMAEKAPTLMVNGRGLSDVALQFDKRIQNETSSLNAMTTMNSLSKDLDRVYALYAFQVKELQNQIDIQNQRLANLDDLIANYGKTGIIYLSTSDSLNKVDTQSSKEYDELVDLRNEVSDQIATLNNRLDTSQKKLDRLESNLGVEKEDSESEETAKQGSGSKETASQSSGSEETARQSSGSEETSKQSSGSEETSKQGSDSKETAEQDSESAEAAKSSTEEGTEAETEDTSDEAPVDAVLEQVDATLQAVDEAAGQADLSETASVRNGAVLEMGIERLVNKGNNAIDSLNGLLQAYNDHEINDLTVRPSSVRYKNPLFSSAFIKKLIKVAGPICAIGFMLALVIIILDMRKKAKTR